jgi:hypothetical protein
MAREKGRRRRRGWVLPTVVTAVLAGVLGSGVMVWKASEAAFSGTTVNPANSWAAGSVTLTDDDGGNNNSSSAMFTATGLKPGAGTSRCIKVTYGGSINAGLVKLYGATPTYTTVSSLAPNISIQIEVGTLASGGTYGNACTGFVQGSIIQSYTPLTTFAAARYDYSTGISSGWTATTGDTSRVFRFTYSVADVNAAQGMDCSMPFTWETQST